MGTVQVARIPYNRVIPGFLTSGEYHIRNMSMDVAIHHRVQIWVVR